MKEIERIVLKDWKKLKEHFLKILKENKRILLKYWNNSFRRLKEIERILLKDGKK